MTFDEELHRSFDPIAERVRAEISRQVQGAIEDLSAQALLERERAVADARTVVTQAASRDLAAAVTAAEARQAAVVAAAEAGAREHALRLSLDLTERLRDAVRAFTQARTLTDTLALLMTSAALEASRVAVLLVQGGHLRVWRLAGFPPQVNADAEPGSWGSVAEAWRTRTAVLSGRAGASAAPAFAELPEGCEGVAVPIVLCGEVVAVLYADRGASDDRGDAPSPAWPDMIELLTRYAAVSLEALTAFKTARALTAPQDGAVSPAVDDVTSGDVTSDDDAAARRYARLLVSEIKLYYEEAVVAGRRDRDLATRLGGEIARARVLYEQRVPPPVRQHADYFHDELVRTLADGDASLLAVGTWVEERAEDRNPEVSRNA